MIGWSAVSRSPVGSRLPSMSANRLFGSVPICVASAFRIHVGRWLSGTVASPAAISCCRAVWSFGAMPAHIRALAEQHDLVAKVVPDPRVEQEQASEQAFLDPCEVAVVEHRRQHAAQRSRRRSPDSDTTEKRSSAWRPGDLVAAEPEPGACGVRGRIDRIPGRFSGQSRPWPRRSGRCR